MMNNIKYDNIGKRINGMISNNASSKNDFDAKDVFASNKNDIQANVNSISNASNNGTKNEMNDVMNFIYNNDASSISQSSNSEIVSGSNMSTSEILNESYSESTNSNQTQSSNSSGNTPYSSESQTSNNEEDMTPESPINPTDPIVVFDPKLVHSTVIRKYNNETPDANVTPEGNKSDFNSVAFDGISMPIVLVNKVNIDYANLIDFKLSICDFFPEIELKIYDYDETLKNSQSPGVSSMITVIIMAPVEGANKKISLTFYMNECKFEEDGTVFITGQMNLNNVRSKHNVQIGKTKLSTYEMLEQIAKDNDLGFAATENCKNISDRRWRQMYSQTYDDFIKEQLSFAGQDCNTIIDAWVDQFGYVVMVDLGWVFSYEVTSKQLTTKKTVGLHTNSKLTERAKETVEDTLRVITNSEINVELSNMIFTDYYESTDNSSIVETGNFQHYYYMHAIGSENKIERHVNINFENSLDGVDALNANPISTCEFIGFDFSDDDDTENTPIVVQKQNVSNFKNKMLSKTITVRMRKPNYMLQRGMLIGVIFEEYDDVTKSSIVSNMNYSERIEDGDSDSSTVNKPLTEEEKKMKDMSIGNPYAPLVNPALSDLYYIKGMTFEYSEGYDGILQTLTLAKKGLRNTLINNSLPQRNITPDKQI